MGWFQDIFGKKPVVPQVPPVSLPAEQQKAITADIAAAPGAEQLARLSTDQIQRMMEAVIPGFGAMGGQISKNILSLVKGQIPGDVATQARIGTAGQALAGGYASGAPGSMASNLEARDLGLTSLGLTQAGLTSAESWLGAMERLFSPSQALFQSMFITPQQEFGAAVEERNLQLERNWLASQIEAMPDPVARGIFDWSNNIGASAANFWGGKMATSSTASLGQEGYSGGASGGGGMGWGGGGGGFGDIGGDTGALGGGSVSALGAFM